MHFCKPFWQSHHFALWRPASPGTIYLTSAQRLVNGSNEYSGRLEVLRAGMWVPVGTPVSSTSSPSGWLVVDVARARASIANLACKLLGYAANRSAVVESPEQFGIPAASAGWWSIYQCGGLEAAFAECRCVKLVHMGQGYNGWVQVPCGEVGLDTSGALAQTQVTVTCPVQGEHCQLCPSLGWLTV